MQRKSENKPEEPMNNWLAAALLLVPFVFATILYLVDTKFSFPYFLLVIAVIAIGELVIYGEDMWATISRFIMKPWTPLNASNAFASAEPMQQINKPSGRYVDYDSCALRASTIPSTEAARAIRDRKSEK